MQFEEEASVDDAVTAARSAKKLKVIVNTGDDAEDNSKADGGTSLQHKPIEPMRAPIKRKTVAKKAPISKATAAKATKLKVTKPVEPAANSAKGGWAGTQFGRSPIVNHKQSAIRAKKTDQTPAEQEDWLAIPGLDY